MLKSMEEEFHSYLRLQHSHLLSYIAFKCTQEPGRFVVYILKEFAGGGNLGQYLKTKTCVGMDLLKKYAQQILDALNFLHSNSVAHKDLRASSLLLDDGGNIRLTDYSINKRLSELVNMTDAGRPSVKFEDVSSLPVIGKGGKKGDIYRLGIILLSLADGILTKDIIPKVPNHHPPQFQDFLQKCLMRDEQGRWSAGQLLEHSFITLPLCTTTFQVKQQGNDSQEGGVQVKGTGKSAAASVATKEEEDTDGDIPFIPRSNESRLQNEFAILKWLGKGGFGDVIKVKNKLDGRLYAIKRIPLNPQRKNFTRKITREVKFLSRLNHENVVRYYNSWIETSEEPVPSDSSSGYTNTATPPSKSTPKSTPSITSNTVPCNKNSLGFNDDIEKFAPPPVTNTTSEWSYDHTDDGNDEDSFEEDEENIFGSSFMPVVDEDSDEDIMFETDESHALEASFSVMGEQNNEKQSNIPADQRDPNDNKEHLVIPDKLQFLYIQMEFCEKSTLRSAIDFGLYQDTDRVWRLFREIVEGLLHIHEQGMIHRDLKPVNIFLDSNDQVKIGDFGLATVGGVRQTDVESLLDISLTQATSFDISSKGGASSRSDSIGADGYLTGKVGTALYVSPEMMNTDEKLYYTQKVDMYSLGVMFFEMCYRPLDTGMERVRILSNVRQPTVIMPEDFDEIQLAEQAYIIKWLLNHDPSNRPTSRELLHSDYLPAPQMEEAELNEILRSAISNPESRSYRRMLDVIFAQPTLAPTDIMYDGELHKAGFKPRVCSIGERVQDILRSVFRKHGALHITTPLMLPKLNVYADSELCVRFMDHSGGVVSLPYDLRVPFARYIARRSISSLKRYTIENVYRENRIYHSHPKEIMCCSFDIVTPTTESLVPDAEVLHVIFDVISEFPALLNRNYRLRINHKCLLIAVLMHCGIDVSLHNEVLSILSDTKTEKQKKFQIQTRLAALSLTEQTVAQLFNFVEQEDLFGKVASMLRCITKTKGEAGSLAKKGLHEMEAIISHGENLGCKLQPTLAIGLMYNVHHFSGVLFQVVTETRKKHRQMLDVLAAGGRYDGLISQYRRPGSPSIPQTVVGIHLYYDKIVSAAQEAENQSDSGNGTGSSLSTSSSHVTSTTLGIDVLVCSLGYKALLKEKLSVLKDLWSLGIAAQLLHDTSQGLEEIQDHCKQNHVSHLIILKHDLDSGFVWLKSFIESKVIDKRGNLGEVLEYIKKYSASKGDSSDSIQSKPVITSQQSVDSSSGHSSSGHSSGSHSSSLPPFNIVFIQQDNTKMAKNTKRVYETQIFSSITTALQHISAKTKVEVLGIELPSQVLKTIAAFLELKEDETDFQNSIGAIVEKHARHRKYLTKIFEYIHELKYEKESCCVILLYGLKDDSYKVLL